jgi:hypothetical protein
MISRYAVPVPRAASAQWCCQKVAQGQAALRGRKGNSTKVKNVLQLFYCNVSSCTSASSRFSLMVLPAYGAGMATALVTTVVLQVYIVLISIFDQHRPQESSPGRCSCTSANAGGLFILTWPSGACSTLSATTALPSCTPRLCTQPLQERDTTRTRY